MPRWTRRWLASANTLLGRFRRPPRGVSAAVGFEAGGRTHAAAAVPWCAAGAVVCVTAAPPRRGAFALALPGRPVLTPASVQTDPDGGTRAVFRFPAPPASTEAVLSRGGRFARSVPIPVLTEDGFRAGLVAAGGVTARLGDYTVSARAVVARQCRGLVAAVTLAHPDTLVPLAALGVTAELVRRDGSTTSVTVATGTAVGPTLTLAAPLPSPGRGRAAVRWRVGGRVVLETPVTGVSLGRFVRTTRVVETGFVADTGRGPAAVRHPPPRAGGRAGPRFTLASSRPGWAGLVLFAVVPLGGDGPGWCGRVLVTDHPTDVAPGLLDLAAWPNVTGFALLLAGRRAAEVLLRPVPAAGFDAEGAFTPPPDFPWTPAADEELADRLGRLE